MIHKATKDQLIFIRSMGKSFRVPAIADNDNEANSYMESHKNTCVIAVFGPLVFLADKYDPGTAA